MAEEQYYTNVEVKFKPGTYVVAVSGGVDSMVLLHKLKQITEDPGGLKLIVAHFDHGIRTDSRLDRKLVEDQAKKYNLPFVYAEGNLGSSVSEASARRARYEFLNRTKSAANAGAIITAHHQDDMIETAILNLLRGTGRKGLTSLRSTADIIRPLLDTSKQTIIEYAKTRNIVWREDSTNQDTVYKRNYVRHKLIPKLNDNGRHQLISHNRRLAKINDEIDRLLQDWLNLQPVSNQIYKYQFVMLPHLVSREVMAAWLRHVADTTLSKDLLERICIAAKTLKSGKGLPINKHWRLNITPKLLALTRHDR